MNFHKDEDLVLLHTLRVSSDTAEHAVLTCKKILPTPSLVVQENWVIQSWKREEINGIGQHTSTYGESTQQRKAKNWHSKGQQTHRRKEEG
ncbi:unnamed protein product [Nezara viridula]|uniref:Uncharacterized protein n=1 Tax=Nezara viridula TaxID=85310 RepID=A0A9P0MQ37_NEZVI|nr:unnamed protein product [Nezara viridula]